MKKKAVALIYSNHHKLLCMENNNLFDHIYFISFSNRVCDKDIPKNGYTFYSFGNEIDSFKKGKIPSQYYKKLYKKINSYNAEALVLFTLNKPVSRYIIDSFDNHVIELWEDGMNHYLTQKYILKDRIKNTLKILFMFYSSNFNKINHGIDKVFIRDRFMRRNLFHRKIYAKPGKKIIIGQPVVEDGYVKKQEYYKIINLLISNGFIYLPHPREKNNPFNTNTNNKIIKSISAEDYIIENGCSFLISVFSTVNFNVETENNILLAKILGLNDISESLHNIAVQAKVEIPNNLDEIISKI